MNKHLKYCIWLILFMIFMLTACKKHKDITGDTTPPVISNVEFSNVTTSSAKIAWDTDELSTTQVEYGTSTNYGTETAEDINMTTKHSVILNNLLQATDYNYRVKSKDYDSNTSISANYTFSTVEIMN